MTFLKTILQFVYVKGHKLMIQTAKLQQKHCQEPSRVRSPHTLSVLADLKKSCTLTKHTAYTRAGQTAVTDFRDCQTAKHTAVQQADVHLCCRAAKSSPLAGYHWA